MSSYFEESNYFIISTTAADRATRQQLRNLKSKKWFTMGSWSIREELGSSNRNVWKAFVVIDKPETCWGLMGLLDNRDWIAYATKMTIKEGFEWSAKGQNCESVINVDH